MKISICIPTYNRSKQLKNCLRSIIANKVSSLVDYQICVSDNGSSDDTEQVVCNAQRDVDINYHRFQDNLGRVRNYLNVVDMADGEFVWLMGDDDLLLPNAIERLHEVITKHQDCDFFFINSYNLSFQYVFLFPQPFETADLPDKMKRSSPWIKDGEMRFIDLVNPKITFDFLGRMLNGVFRRVKWMQNVKTLDEKAVADHHIFSHFDNTFPQLKIVINAFSRSKAYFYSQPLSVCLYGAREWSPMGSLVHSVRLVEALDEYRKNGLSYISYLRCKNFALRDFIPHLVSMWVNRDNSGYNYVRPFRLVLSNCLYPNFYLSLPYYLFKKAKKKILTLG